MSDKKEIRIMDMFDIPEEDKLSIEKAGLSRQCLRLLMDKQTLPPLYEVKYLFDKMSVPVKVMCMEQQQRRREEYYSNKARVDAHNKNIDNSILEMAKAARNLRSDNTGDKA